jgi:hypothetical protein
MIQPAEIRIQTRNSPRLQLTDADSPLKSAAVRRGIPKFGIPPSWFRNDEPTVCSFEAIQPVEALPFYRSFDQSRKNVRRLVNVSMANKDAHDPLKAGKICAGMGVRAATGLKSISIHGAAKQFRSIFGDRRASLFPEHALA